MWNSKRPKNPDMPSAPRPGGLSSILKNIFKSEAKAIHMDDVSSKDAIIAVMGPTGSGKSSFIELATGFAGIVGHGLSSFTNEVSVIKLSFPGLVDSDICFIDTPGFDDTNKSDVDIFKMISDWLNKTYKKNMRLSGLLYFHRISDNRMAGTPLRNFHLFEKICGEFDRIILTTTMWNDVDDKLGGEREEELKTLYWKSMVDRGSCVKRFLYTRESAFDVLGPIFDQVNSRNALLLQKEMNDLGLRLKETSAGRALFVELGELIGRQQDILENIRRELREPTMDADQLRILMDEHQQVSVQLLRTTNDMRKMKIKFGDRIQRAARAINWKTIPWSSMTTGFSFQTDRAIKVITEDVAMKSQVSREEQTTAIEVADGFMLLLPKGDNPDAGKENRESRAIEQRIDGNAPTREERQEVLVVDLPTRYTLVLEDWVRIYLPWVEIRYSAQCGSESL